MATEKLPVRFGRNGARSLVPLNRVHKVLIQARTGPPRRSESNESIEHIGTPCCLLMLLASATPAEDRLVSCRIQQRSVLMRTDEERTGCRAKGKGQSTMRGPNRFDLFGD